MNKNTIKITQKPIETTTRGVLSALIAFTVWGAFPLYFKLLSEYNAIEVITHRIVWTFLFLAIFIIVTGRFSWIKLFKEEPKWIFFTVISGLIISTNWLTYVWAVNDNRLLEASLGYFMSPLVGVGLSLIVLKEKLRKLQWIAISVALSAVIIELVMLGNLPWVSLVLAISFAVYGLMQRRTPLMPVDSLFVETAVILPLMMIWLMQADVASSHLELWLSNEVWLLMLAGPITLVPLLLFNKSTKLVAYSILSFMNYLTPSFVFLLAVFYYNEPFDHNQLMVFGLIWIALFIFSIDLWQNRPSKMKA